MYYKYPRTRHVPWTDSHSSDDKVMSYKDMTFFRDKRVIVTEKMDGGNTSLYRDHIHARSVDSNHHESQAWVKNFWAGIKADIPKGWRICGEDMYAMHSILYSDLDSYFLGFSIWDDQNIRLSWDDTLEWFELFGITPVKVLYDGYFDMNQLFILSKNTAWFDSEGFVIALADAFHYDDFEASVAKYVRPNHVRTSSHWRSQEVYPNRLKTEDNSG